LPDRGTLVRGKRPPEGEPVVDRALSLLSAFDARQRRLTLAELSRRSGMPVSTTLRLATRLVSWGALERDERGRYCIGLRLLEVASLAPRGHGLRQVALPFMGDLAEVTRQHVQLGVRDGTEATLVERLSAHQATPVQYRVDGRLPLHSTALGLVLFAFAPWTCTMTGTGVAASGRYRSSSSGRYPSTSPYTTSGTRRTGAVMPPRGGRSACRTRRST
jgi:IclR helix-turn-helix domain